MIGLVVTTAEQLFRIFAPMLEPYAPALVGALYRALPGYHLANVGSWITDGRDPGGALPLGGLLDAVRGLARHRRRLDALLAAPHLLALPPAGHQLAQNAPDRAEVVAGGRRRATSRVAVHAPAVRRQRPEIGRARPRTAEGEQLALIQRRAIAAT